MSRRCVGAVARAIEKLAKNLGRAANSRPIPSASGRILHGRASEVAAVAESLRSADMTLRLTNRFENNARRKGPTDMTKIEPAVSDVEETHRAAYYGILDELIDNANIVAAASPEDLRYMEEECGFNLENFEVSRRELEKQRLGSAPPDPLLMKAAARRLAGVKPVEPKAEPDQSPSLARVYVAALRCRNTLFDDVLKEFRREAGRTEDEGNVEGR